MSNTATETKKEPQEQKIPYDGLVSTILIYLLLFSVLLSFMQEVDFFKTFFEPLINDFNRGSFRSVSIILLLMLILPPIIAYFFFIFGFLEIITNRFNKQGIKPYLEIAAFILFSFPLIFLILEGSISVLLLLLYSIFIIYALKNYEYLRVGKCLQVLIKF